MIQTINVTPSTITLDKNHEPVGKDMTPLFSLSGVSRVHTPRSPQFRLRFCVPEAFLTLIREKPAQLFCDSPVPLSVRLSWAISKLEITANSTYWEANLHPDRTGVAEAGIK